MAAPRAFAAHTGADAHLRVGVVGCGGRGKGAAKDALDAGPDVKIVAMADAFADNLESARVALAEMYGERVDVPEERRFTGFDCFRGVLSSDIDLVILATPPGFRPQHFTAAVEAGKHVFMEKPVAVDAPGVRAVIEAGRRAKEAGLAVGVGLQRRHEPRYIDTIQRIWDGALGGETLYTRVYWNMGDLWTRNRKPEQTELQYQMRNWYYFAWLCGDHIVEQHIHNIDVSNWLKRAVPVKASGMGGRQVRTGKDHGQIFDHHAVEFTYADGATMMSQCRQIAGTTPAVTEFAHGPDGWCHVSGGRFFDRSGNATDRVRGPSYAGYLQEHVDLQASIRDGSPLNETLYGAEATMTAILGRMATYSGRVVTWDEAFASEVRLAPEINSWGDTPPVSPDDDGRYPVPVPGVTEVV